MTLSRESRAGHFIATFIESDVGNDLMVSKGFSVPGEESSGIDMAETTCHGFGCRR